jgi:nitrite reductase/ring-hydroxylating ferredoxin subunit
MQSITRCPHEGYPLAAGQVSPGDCVLTCNWHNWKFRLDTGECLIGGDHVRGYPDQS